MGGYQGGIPLGVTWGFESLSHRGAGFVFFRRQNAEGFPLRNEEIKNTLSTIY